MFSRWTPFDIAEALISGVLVIVMLVAIGGYGYGLYREIAAREVARPGDLIQGEHGEYPLYAECRGASADGAPTVILEAPLVVGGLIWSEVMDALAEDAFVCRYDRAGLGWSQASGSDTVSTQRGRQAADYVNDLNRVLDFKEVRGRVILVGAGYGGLLSRYYAREQSTRVAALVLVDSLTEKYLGDCGRPTLQRLEGRVSSGQWAAELGMTHIWPDRWLREWLAPTGVPRDALEPMRLRRTWRATILEVAALPEILRVVERPLSAGELPQPIVTIVSRDARLIGTQMSTSLGDEAEVAGPDGATPASSAIESAEPAIPRSGKNRVSTQYCHEEGHNDIVRNATVGEQIPIALAGSPFDHGGEGVRAIVEGVSRARALSGLD